MDRIIIIDDNGIQNDLNHFLKENKNHIRLDSDIFEFSKGSNSILQEIINSYENKFKIKIKSKDQIYIFRVNEILYVEAKNKITILHLNDREPVELDYSIQMIEEQLLNYPFLLVHQDYIININHINSISDDSNYVAISNGDKVPISSDKKKIILNKIEKYF